MNLRHSYSPRRRVGNNRRAAPLYMTYMNYKNYKINNSYKSYKLL